MQDSTGAIRPHDMAFLLPHEVLAVVAQHSSPDIIYDLAGLDPSGLCQVQVLLEKWGLDQLIPISLWSDTVPYSWDRSESVEVYSWHLPGQSHKPYRNMRVPFAIVQHHHCCKSTHEEIMRVWVWSMASLAKGSYPSHGPGGVQLSGAQRIKSAGKDLLIKAATVELKADWKWYSEVLGLPRWNNNAGICWRCNIKLEDLQDVGLKAAWRQQRNRLSHADLLATLATNHTTLSPMWSCPGFTSAMVKLDWMHILDQGVTQYFVGSILFFLVRLARYGQNKEIRCSQVWRLILDFYQENPGVKDKLKSLKLNRFDHKPPHLKASAAQIRALVPFLRVFCRHGLQLSPVQRCWQ